MHTERREPQRDEQSLESILARGRARRRRRHYVYPPDFQHGSAELDVLHRTFGAEWAESTAFVSQPHDRDGPTDGWTVATFDAHFLEIDHLSSRDGSQLENELRAHLRDCTTVVGLSLHDGRALPNLSLRARAIPVDTTTHRLRSLERQYLGVSRERELREASLQTGAEDILLATRLDLLSMVGLCAELVDQPA